MVQTTLDFDTYLTSIKEHINKLLDSTLPQKNDNNLHQAMRYSCLSGGKRLRPTLVYATGDCLGLQRCQLDALAISVECLHTYSLIHDDLPCMDNDSLRRGKATCHIKFNESTAVLAGDALQAFAFEVIVNPKLNPASAEQKNTMVALLANAIGPKGMVLGQYLDLNYSNNATSLLDVTNMYKLKTSKLLKVCILLAATAANLNETLTANLLDFANNISLAFQIVDDILEATQTTQTIGKSNLSDLTNDKTTFVKLLGVNGAKEQSELHYQQALTALNSLPFDTSLLKNTANFILKRNY